MNSVNEGQARDSSQNPVDDFDLDEREDEEDESSIAKESLSGVIVHDH